MGNTNDSVSVSNGNDSKRLQQYSFVRALGTNKHIYSDNKSGKQFVSVSRSFASEQALAQYEKQIRRTLSLQHPYYLNEKEHITFTISNLCSIQHKVMHMFEYEEHTLLRQLRTRALYKRHFEEKEIWSILCSCVLAMSHLTKNQISHASIHPKDIVIDKTGMIKVVSQVLSSQVEEDTIDGTHTGYKASEAESSCNPSTQTTSRSSLQKKHYEKGSLGYNEIYYYSPEQLKALKNEQILLNEVYGIVENANKPIMKGPKSSSKSKSKSSSLSKASVAKEDKTPQFMYVCRPPTPSSLSNGLSMNSTNISSPIYMAQSSNPNNKAAIFSLGVTLLHILSLQDMSNLYNLQSCSINMKEVNRRIQQVQQPQIKDMIKRMLKEKTYDRISFPELEEMLCSILEEQEKPEAVVSESENQAKSKSQIQEGAITSNNRNNNHPLTDSINPSDSISQNNLHHHEHERNLSYSSTTTPIQLQRLQQSINRLDKTTTDNQTRKIGGEQSTRGGGFRYSLQQQFHDYEDIEAVDHTIGENPQFYKRGVSHAIDKQVIDQEDHHRNQYIRTSRNMSNVGRENIFKENTFGCFNLNSHHMMTAAYVTEHLPRGTYEGHKVNNMRHGYGTFTYAEGGKYSGEWNMNRMQGRGVLYYASEYDEEKIAYEGEWHQDKLNGYGVLYNEFPENLQEQVEIDYKSLNLLNGTDYWLKYQGGFINDEKSGQGTLTFTNGQTYRGYFKDDLPHGNGIFTNKNGKSINGKWILGQWKD